MVITSVNLPVVSMHRPTFFWIGASCSYMGPVVILKKLGLARPRPAGWRWAQPSLAYPVFSLP